LLIYTGAAERARIDSSGNLGIGTASPGARAEVFQTSTSTPSLRLRYNASSVYANHSMDGNGNYIVATPASNGVTGGRMLLAAGALPAFSPTGESVGIATNGSVRALFDASGNLGLGVTPSAWNSAFKAVQIGAAASLSALSNSSYLSANCFYDSVGWKYIATDVAAQYHQENGAHKWFTAASGTAGNAITFTERMAISAAGAVTIGGTLGVTGTISGAGTNTWALQSVGTSGSLVAGGWLYGINEGLNFAPNGAGLNKRLVLAYWDGGAYREAIGYSNVSSGTSTVAILANGGATTIGGTLGVTGAATFATGINVTGNGGFFNSANKFGVDVSGSATRFYASGSDAVTGGSYEFHSIASDGSPDTVVLKIATSGNVGIGTTTPAETLDVKGTGNFNGVSGTYVGFQHNGTTVGYAATANAVLSGGATTNFALAAVNNLVFGIGSAEKARIDSSGNFLHGTTDSGLTTGVGYKSIYSATNPYTGIVITGSTNTETNWHLYSTGAAAYRFYVGGAGTVFATNTAISAISDARLKENVRDLDVGLDAILALRPRTFDWKEGKGSNVKDVRGFIAQEFEQVFPDLIDEWKDPAPEGEEPYKSVRQDLIPVLVKAIQELNTRLLALEAA